MEQMLVQLVTSNVNSIVEFLITNFNWLLPTALFIFSERLGLSTSDVNSITQLLKNNKASK